MENNTTDITKFTIDQLKSLAYDQMILLQRIQLNLNNIQVEIEKRKLVEGGTAKDGRSKKNNNNE